MNFRDVPNLLKFEQHARRNDTCEITMDAYRKVREIIRDAPAPMNPLETGQQPPVDELKASCAAIEKSTRILWACAAATCHVNPPFWDYTPDYEAALSYFLELDDLELMAITKTHRIEWEQAMSKS